MRPRVEHSAKLDQVMPVLVVAREARDLSRCDSADIAQTNFGNHPLKSRARTGRLTRPAEIVVNNLDLLPSERLQPLLHRVL
jgi:hypothetical protein